MEKVLFIIVISNASRCWVAPGVCGWHCSGEPVHVAVAYLLDWANNADARASAATPQARGCLARTSPAALVQAFFTTIRISLALDRASLHCLPSPPPSTPVSKRCLVARWAQALKQHRTWALPRRSPGCQSWSNSREYPAEGPPSPVSLAGAWRAPLISAMALVVHRCFAD